MKECQLGGLSIPFDMAVDIVLLIHPENVSAEGYQVFALFLLGEAVKFDEHLLAGLSLAEHFLCEVVLGAQCLPILNIRFTA